MRFLDALLVAVLCALTCGSAPGRAQTPPAFEAASVRPNRSGDVDQTAGFQANRFRGNNATARLLLSAAFGSTGADGRSVGLRQWLIVGGPDWLDKDTYDVEAVAPMGTPPDVMRQMLRTFLADRFKLRAHEETRELPLYALVTARTDRRLGPQLTVSDGSNCLAPGTPRPADSKAPACGSMFRTNDGSAFISNGFAITMDQLANSLSSMLRRNVLNETRLSDRYDLTKFRYTPPPTTASPTNDPLSVALPDNGTHSSLFTALEEQLGLRLESRRGPTRVVVIDHVERPTEN